MGIFDRFRSSKAVEAAQGPVVTVLPAVQEAVEAPRAMAGEASTFYSLDDPRLLEFIRRGDGASTGSGMVVTTEQAMRNTAVLRSVLLISNAIGMLPLHLQRRDDKTKAENHPLFKVLHRRPNGWMTAFEFRQLMQKWALCDGSAIARKVKVGSRIVALLPIAKKKWSVEQAPSGALQYRVNRDGGSVILQQDEVFHLRGPLSDDGITGMAIVKQAAEAIGLAIQSEQASARIFKNGVMAGLVLTHPKGLSQKAFDNLKESLSAREGADGAYKTLILEDGLSVASGPGVTSSAKDAQALEQRGHQIEEIGRAFGVPRPLLGMDDTSWGSGIDVLGQMFVQYGLNPWFEAWQQAIERDLLSEEEAEIYQAKFNPAALLRGSMQAQAEFFAKALGSAVQPAWMVPEEVRDALDLPRLDMSKLPALPGNNGGGNVAS
jgi:HK97 family phage portal protein